MHAGSSIKTDYGTLDGVRLLADKIKDFWKRRGVAIQMGINQSTYARGNSSGAKSIYTLSSDIGLRPEFRITRICIPVKDGDAFYAVSA